MTTIFTVVDASMQQLAQQDQSRPRPTEDFAHELAKQPPQAKQQAQSNGKATIASREFGQEQTFEPVKAGTVAVTEDPLPQMELPVALVQRMEAAEPITVATTGATETLLEARVFGWHAMAQAYLSELTVADGGASQSDISQNAQALASAQSAITSEAPATSALATSVVAEESTSTLQVEPLVKFQQSTPSDDAAPAKAIEQASTDVSAPDFWPERSLRFTRQRDGSNVAWLRDFRLSHAEASHLIQVVLNDAKEKGVALSRIMLNGREAWASQNAT